MNKVAVLYCTTYDENIVYEKLKTGLELIGGFDSIFTPSDKILLKMNLLRPAPVEKAITTHPAIVNALVRILDENGCHNITAGDSSGFGAAAKAISELGLDKTFEKYNITQSDFKEAVHVPNPSGLHAKEFQLAKDVIDTDCLVSLSKMKTHAFQYITGAVKNQYGCISGMNKAKGHTTYPSQESFAKMLIDLNLVVGPKLYILDGIIAMEGNGPASGTPVPMNVLILSTDPIAIDSIFCHLIHLDPKIVPTNVFGEKMGLGTYKENELEIWLSEGGVDEAHLTSFAELREKYGNPSFDVLRTKHTSTGIMALISGLRRFKNKPRIDLNLCKKCGICVDACPVEGKALHFSKGKQNPPVYEYRKCIRCFCCQEMCPHKAIYVK